MLLCPVNVLDCPNLKDGLAVKEQGTNAELLLISLDAYNKKTE